MVPVLLILNYLKREQLAKENQHKRENQKRFIEGRGISCNRFCVGPASCVFQDLERCVTNARLQITAVCLSSWESFIWF